MLCVCEGTNRMLASHKGEVAEAYLAELGVIARATSHNPRIKTQYKVVVGCTQGFNLVPWTIMEVIAFKGAPGKPHNCRRGRAA